jgi:hypothetical protein
VRNAARNWGILKKTVGGVLPDIPINYFYYRRDWVINQGQKLVLSMLLPIGIFFLSFVGCEKSQKLEFSMPYQVVFLDNNNAYIGKIQQSGKEFIYLTDVFYIQSKMNSESKQMANSLIKRGNEAHKPTFMYINTHHIVMIEPVAPDSQVAKLIEQSEAEGRKPIQQSETKPVKPMEQTDNKSGIPNEHSATERK